MCVYVYIVSNTLLVPSTTAALLLVSGADTRCDASGLSCSCKRTQSKPPRCYPRSHHPPRGVIETVKHPEVSSQNPSSQAVTHGVQPSRDVERVKTPARALERPQSRFYGMLYVPCRARFCFARLLLKCCETFILSFPRRVASPFPVVSFVSCVVLFLSAPCDGEG